MKHHSFLFSVFIILLCSCEMKSYSEADVNIYGLVLFEISQKYSDSIYLKEELSEPSDSLTRDHKRASIPEQLKVRVSTLAKNKNLNLHWVTATQKLDFEKENGKIVGGGVLVSFTQVEYGSSGTAEIEANIFISSEEAFGKKYSLKLENETWVLKSVERTWVTWLFNAWPAIT